jgi:hypothetical protein
MLVVQLVTYAVIDSSALFCSNGSTFFIAVSKNLFGANIIAEPTAVAPKMLVRTMPRCSVVMLISKVVL